jgi:hypothetical protein
LIAGADRPAVGLNAAYLIADSHHGVVGAQRNQNGILVRRRICAVRADDRWGQVAAFAIALMTLGGRFYLFELI